MLVRRERWSLSGAGWLLAAAVAGVVCVGFVRGVHPFLAVNDGGDGDVMVVEGWIGGRRLAQAASAFQRGHYRCVVVVRDVYGNGDKWSSGRYSADYIAADLAKEGVPKDYIHTVFCPVFQQDRTYHCALAARTWLANNHMAAKQLDVVTIGCHSRRSRLLYEKAFGGAVKVAAISLEDPTFDAARWWRSSEGVRDVPFEFIAYLYARFFFTGYNTPPAPSQTRQPQPSKPCIFSSWQGEAPAEPLWAGGSGVWPPAAWCPLSVPGRRHRKRPRNACPKRLGRSLALPAIA